MVIMAERASIYCRWWKENWLFTSLPLIHSCIGSCLRSCEPVRARGDTFFLLLSFVWPMEKIRASTYFIVFFSTERSALSKEVICVHVRLYLDHRDAVYNSPIASRRVEFSRLRQKCVRTRRNIHLAVGCVTVASRPFQSGESMENVGIFFRLGHNIRTTRQLMREEILTYA